MKRGHLGLLLFALAFAPGIADAQPKKDASWLLPAPEVEADPNIPTLKHVVGHTWAQEISSHSEIERYVRALAKAAPDRCKLVTYGQSNQGKDLFNLIITSPENMKRLDTIREQNLALADPRLTPLAKAEEIAAKAPAVVWFAYCVHGNETSPSDAAVLTAYHLLADKKAATREMLEKLVVIIDPLQNPDGRDRFVNFHRETRGGFDQDNPLSADRLERWPGGRSNHYLFDMNRDWFLQTQKETKARVSSFLAWKPQIFVDAHEMGSNSTFFFDPSTEPYNPHTLPRQKEWHMKIGRTHAEHFDKHGFAYTTREMFDAFGPQYGSTWPIMHGSIGILWEQAGVRGRVITRQDQTKLYYHDGVRHHYISGLATLEAAAKNRQQLLIDFHRNAADSIKLGDSGPIRAFFLLEGKRRARAWALARMLLRNGIEVHNVTAPLKVQATETLGEKAREYDVPVGSYYIPLNQPAARLALTLLERHQDMGAAYIKRQEDRVKRNLPDEIYDSTSWSLPLAYDITCLATSSRPDVTSTPIPPSGKRIEIVGVGKPPRIGYLASGDDDSVMPALCQWLSMGLRVHVFSEPTKVEGKSYPRGSVLLRVAENPDNLHNAVNDVALAHGLTVHGVDKAFVEEGASLGGPNVHWIKPPRVLLMVDRPATYAVGHAWYVFDQVWRYPVTRVAGNSLPKVDWSKFDVCVFPNGTYTGGDAPSEDTVRRMKDWVQGGGTLVLVGGAAAWATNEKVKLLASKLEYRKSEDKEEKKDEKEKTDKRLPLDVPGVFLRATIDDDHFTTWGMNKEAAIYYHGNRIFHPLKSPAGKNLVTIVDRTDALASGYCWPETLQMVRGKSFLMHQSLGKGHIVAFADDPTYRAFSPTLQKMFFNAVFFGPAR